MKSASIIIAGIAAAGAAGCASSGRLSAPAVVAKNAEARGGIEAWRKVETMQWIGRIESSHAPMPGLQFELDQKRPNRTRIQITTIGEKSARAFNGVRGWKVRWSHGQPEVQPFTPQELKYAQSGPGIEGPLMDHVAKGIPVALEGVEEMGGRKTYHLSLRAAGGGGAEDIWVDAESFLEVRYDRVADAPGGMQRRVSSIYRDYRDVQGVQVPFQIETGGGEGATPDRMLIDRVVLNAPLEDSAFENPAAAHARDGRLSLGPVPR